MKIDEELCENRRAGSGEVEARSGDVEAVQLFDPERARLNE
jgi:hypothetical protein